MAHDGPMALSIGIYGQGAWGRALGQVFQQGGHRLRTWSRRDGGEPAALLADQDVIVCAIAMAGVPELSQRLSSHWPPGLPLISCTKGLNLQQRLTASQLWQRSIPSLSSLVLSGPNLAGELQGGLPAASVLASLHSDLARSLQQDLSSDQLRLYTNTDPIGTELSGALKNVMAVAAGISDGLALGANAKASLLCRGLAEIGVVLEGLGGLTSTLYGLAGLGDLLATANSSLSRNYRCGLLLAQGYNEEQANAQIAATVEGTRTARAALQLAERHSWHLPICEQVVRVLDGLTTPAEAVRALMERGLRPEMLEP